jgi:hypothetical protein
MRPACEASLVYFRKLRNPDGIAEISETCLIRMTPSLL